MANQENSNLAGVNAPRLFVGNCFGIAATAVFFAVVAGLNTVFKDKFGLSGEQAGYISGAGLWGFTVSIFVFGPLVDVIGMGRLLGVAFVFHVLGVLLLMVGHSFGVLFVGALLGALGNGTIQAVVNPLTVTLYPNRIAQMMNRMHMWFPAGICVGGVLFHFMGADTSYKIKLALVLIPTAIYGLLYLGAKFPKTERAAAGESFGSMVAGAFGNPLFWLLFFCMMITASMELGPGNWIPDSLKDSGVPGILVLAYINLLMAILRFNAGYILKRIPPTGILFFSAILATAGLFLLSVVGVVGASKVVLMVVATLFAVGVCYFWPTMLGVTGMRVSKGGSLSLSLVNGVGMLAVGLIAAPQMGNVTDYNSYKALTEKTAEVKVVFEQAQADPKLGPTAKKVLAAIEANKGVLPEEIQGDTPTAPATKLVSILRTVNNEAAKDSAVAKAAGSVLTPADNYGARMSFRKLSLFGFIIILAFGMLFMSDRAKAQVAAAASTPSAKV